MTENENSTVRAAGDLDEKVRTFLGKITEDLGRGVPVFSSDSSESSETSETSEASETTESSEGHESGGSEDGEGSILLKSLLAVDPSADQWGAILDRAAPLIDELERR
ncbi:hypothetical protein L1785_08680 [Antribacter sp. KLBMP9083]|uniref:Uncharacterized protein n=1 Tax=Antribacter soli TaxID=2910976 RepID=A0AA41QEC2_9MICO|nr:hypothetical protein [Antribacter soli]MCF4121056.1 hypothetical protein [Antribacter soli]